MQLAQTILGALAADPDGVPGAATARLAALDAAGFEVAVSRLLPDRVARRWLRRALLPRLPTGPAAALAERLLAFPDDFGAMHRDRTTPSVVAHLAMPALRDAAPFLAGGNAATALWERLASEGPDAVLEAARTVLASGTALGRETTLYLLLVDRFPPVALPPAERRSLIELGLADPDEETRGLAAEVAASEMPGLLLEAPDRQARDSSERVRTAVWDVAFGHDPEGAAAAATALVGDVIAPLPARQSALLAVGEYLPMERVEDLLARAVVDPDEGLALAAAGVLWSRQRSPKVALAAARSPHAAVRAIAERLLHPTLGSPAAGGFRPGAADQGFDLYDRFRQEMRGGDGGARHQEP